MGHTGELVTAKGVGTEEILAAGTHQAVGGVLYDRTLLRNEDLSRNGQNHNRRKDDQTGISGLILLKTQPDLIGLALSVIVFLFHTLTLTSYQV